MKKYLTSEEKSIISGVVLGPKSLLYNGGHQDKRSREGEEDEPEDDSEDHLPHVLCQWHDREQHSQGDGQHTHGNLTTIYLEQINV